MHIYPSRCCRFCSTVFWDTNTSLVVSAYTSTLFLDYLNVILLFSNDSTYWFPCTSDYLCFKIFFVIFILAIVFKIIVPNSSLFTAYWGQVHSLYVLRFSSTPHLQIFDWNYLGNPPLQPFAIYTPTHPILFNVIVLIIWYLVEYRSYLL